VQRASRIPDDVALVLRPNPRTALRERAPSIAVFVLTVAVAALGVVATGTVFGVWLVVGLLCVAGLLVELLILRSDVGLGPSFAADAEHVWVRVGGFQRPTSVRLGWDEITGIALRTWRGRRGATARYLTVKVTEPLRPELDRLVDRRLRRLADMFGSPLAISERHKTTSLDDAVRGLRGLAPDGVRFTST